jgi:hypothetical protein
LRGWRGGTCGTLREHRLNRQRERRQKREYPGSKVLGAGPSVIVNRGWLLDHRWDSRRTRSADNAHPLTADHPILGDA